MGATAYEEDPVLGLTTNVGVHLAPLQTADTACTAGTPERRLFLALLTDAIQRCRRLRADPRVRRRELYEAERWILSDDRHWPCSFVNVCEALDIESRSLRRAILEWRPETALAVNRTLRQTLLAKRRPRIRAAAARPTANHDRTGDATNEA